MSPAESAQLLSELAALSPHVDLDAPDDDLVDPVLLAGLEVPVRRWLLPGLIPWHVPTMISGMGGLGKTLLGCQLVHAVATNLQWLGRTPEPVKSFAVFCEDDKDELHRRFHDINVNMLTGFNDLGDLRYMVRNGKPSALMEFDGPYGSGSETEFSEYLVKQIRDFGAHLILLDSLYNFFTGNENNRVQVSQFVYLLRRIAVECDAALVFLAHPSKSGISTGEGYAGSTAWHDAVRSRLYLTEEDREGERRLFLKTMKANYAAKGDEIEVYYQGGMLWPKQAEQVDKISFELQAEIAFMKCLEAARVGGRITSDSPHAGNYAPKMFKVMVAAKGFRARDLAGAMERLFAASKIEIRTETDQHRNRVKGIRKVERTAPQEGLQNDENEPL